MSRPRKFLPHNANPPVRRDDPEPSLAELLDDPVIRILMARDGVGCGELFDAIDVARARLGLETPAERLCGPSAFEATLYAECQG